MSSAMVMQVEIEDPVVIQPPVPPAAEIDRAVEWLRGTTRPVVIAGGGSQGAAAGGDPLCGTPRGQRHRELGRKGRGA